MFDVLCGVLSVEIRGGGGDFGVVLSIGEGG
jgi:hypothetical protein